MKFENKVFYICFLAIFKFKALKKFLNQEIIFKFDEKSQEFKKKSEFSLS